MYAGINLDSDGFYRLNKPCLSMKKGKLDTNNFSPISFNYGP